mgnify:CR=1 FL=1
MEDAAALNLIARERKLLKSSRKYKQRRKENVDPQDSVKTTPLRFQKLQRENRELKREKEQILCTLEGDVEIEHVLGDEFQTSGGEVFRVATISLLEIV